MASKGQIKKTSPHAKTEGPGTHMTFLLPGALRTRLAEVGGERGIGEEIRKRLEVSFEGTPPTRRFLDLISSTSRDVSEFYGEWHQNPFAFLVFKSALNTLLANLKPQGQPVPNPNPDSLADVLFGTDDPAEHIGERIAALVLHGEKKETK